MGKRQVKHQEPQLEQKVPDVKLREYLDSLLQEATETLEQAIVEEQTIETQTAVLEKKAVEAVDELPEKVVPEPFLEAQKPALRAPEKELVPPENIKSPFESAEASPSKQKGKPEQTQDRELPPTGIPVWAENQFDCLLFDVAGLKLAAPLVCLGGIIQIEGGLTPLFSQPSWMLGLLTNHYGKTRVVDTANWVMPEKYRPEMKEAYQFVITINDSKWALACDHIVQSITLQKDEVRWRSKRTSRTWLAGTSTKEMCAIVDVETLAKELNHFGGQLDDEKVKLDD